MMIMKLMMTMLMKDLMGKAKQSSRAIDKAKVEGEGRPREPFQANHNHYLYTIYSTSILHQF